jgi:hypothetical protein
MRFGVDIGNMAGGLSSLGRKALLSGPGRKIVQRMTGVPAAVRAFVNKLDDAAPYINNVRAPRPIRRLSDQLKQDRRLAKRSDYIQQVFDKDEGVGNQVFRRSMEKSPEYQDYIGRQIGNDNLRMNAYMKSSPRPQMRAEDINMNYVHANYKSRIPKSLQRERATAAYNSDPFFRDYYHGGPTRAAAIERARQKAIENAARREAETIVVYPWDGDIPQPTYPKAIWGKERMDFDRLIPVTLNRAVSKRLVTP